MTTSDIVGAQGEAAAASYLTRKKWTVLEQNRRFGQEEIDIIAHDPDEAMFVFVEVKSRSSFSPAYPIRTAMTRRKRAALRRAIARWMREQDYDGCARIDLIVVVQNHVVEHLMDLGSEFII